MKYPYLSELQTSRKMVDVFRGYNHNLRIDDGEFYDMTNLSSADYPVLSPRHARGVYIVPSVPQGMIAKDVFCYVDGGDIIIGEHRIPLGLSIDKDENGNIIPKKLISMGAYVIILPDKKYINTTILADQGSIEETVTTTSEVTFSLCMLDGVEYKNIDIQPIAPPNPTNLAYWLDNSTIPNALKQYSATSGMWVSVATTYIKISSPGIGQYFAAGDGVTISGIEDEALADLNSTMIIQASGTNFIVVTGILDQVITQETPICVSRWMPDLDFIVESKNRLWGCRYGRPYLGKVYDEAKGETVDQWGYDPVNEIYACKLGDFKNWNCFAGISTDSYAVTVGTDGQFTGAITYLGYPLFFKENCMHKVYGDSMPFGVQDTACRGVQKGCSESLAIVNETLFYKSRSAICAFDGSLPVEISSALGDVTYSKAVAGDLGNKYYISMLSDSGKYDLFVFDVLKGMWHREDNTEVMQFCNYRGDLYYIDRKDLQIKTVLGTGTLDTDPINWEAITGIIGTDSPDKKYVSRIDVRMHIPVGSRVMFFVEYDSDGHWQYLFTMTGMTLKSFPVPIRPLRCDHLRIKIVGEGEAKIFSICQTFEQGSDL